MDSSDVRMLALSIELSSTRGRTIDELIDAGLLDSSRNTGRQSKERTFYRYLEHLDSLGFKVTSPSASGERSRYRVDPILTYAEPADIYLDQDELLDLFALLTAYLQDSDMPYAHDVEKARDKLADIMGASVLVDSSPTDATGTRTRGAHQAPSTTDQPVSVYHTCIEAWSHRHELSFDYTGAVGTTRRHTVQIWGMFDRLGKTYAVAHDNGSDTVLVFRLDRIAEKTLSVDKRTSYEIPADFDVIAYRGLPFSYGLGEPREATFVARGASSPNQYDSLIESTGSWHAENGACVWTTQFRDLDACAAWAAGAALEGLMVTDPPDLVARTKTVLEEAARFHG